MSLARDSMGPQLLWKSHSSDSGSRSLLGIVRQAGRVVRLDYSRQAFFAFLSLSLLTTVCNDKRLLTYTRRSYFTLDVYRPPKHIHVGYHCSPKRKHSYRALIVDPE